MGIDQTFKNIQRLSQIAGVFGAHGFSQVMKQIGLLKLVKVESKPESSVNLSAAVRLRMAFDELGPTFIKLGQTLSLRSDLLPPDFIAEFKKLQDNASPFAVADVRHQIEKELETSIEEFCESLDETPIGAASLAQVHRARLKSGEDVVIKVRRPGIEDQIDTDLSILYTIARMLDRYMPLTAVVDPLEVVDEFARSIRQELDFAGEAGNLERFAKNFADDDKVHFPQVFWKYTGRRVLTMSYIDGVCLKNIDKLDELGIDKKAFGKLGARTFMKMIFMDGFFHGDIHGGNLFAMRDNSIGIIDCGIVGKLDRHIVAQTASIFVSLLTRDFDSVARIFIDLGGAKSGVNEREFARDLRSVIEPLMGLSLKDISTGEVFFRLTQVALKHRVRLPRETLLLARSISGIESIGRELDPEFDAMSVGREFAGNVIAERYSPQNIASDLVQIGRDLTTLGRNMPKQLESFLRRLERDELAFDLRVRDVNTWKLLDRIGSRIAMAVLFVGGLITISLNSDKPLSMTDFLGYLTVIGSLSGFVFSVIKGKDRP